MAAMNHPIENYHAASFWKLFIQVSSAVMTLKAPETIGITNQGERECKVNSAIEKWQQIMPSTNMTALRVP